MRSVLFAMMALGSAQPSCQKIWKRFYRVNTARSSGDDSGTGLGLAMVNGWSKVMEEQ